MIIKRPIITEKSKLLAEKRNTYVFEVGSSSTKNKIRSEIEKNFDVTVIDIKTINIKGKVKRQPGRRNLYKRSDIKKAYVTIKSGDKIDIFQKSSKR